MRMVQCAKLKKEAEGMDRNPYPKVELGQRIYDSISKEAWKEWIAHSTMLVNEYRIDMSSKQGTTFLLEQAEKFFFGDGVAKPEGYVPPSEEKKP